jgi:hypothetical protein
VAEPADAAATAASPRGMRTFGVLWATQTLSLFGTFVTQWLVTNGSAALQRPISKRWRHHTATGRPASVAGR